MGPNFKDGDVVVISKELVGGTIIGKSDNGYVLITRAGFIRTLKGHELIPYEDGMELKEENDVGSKDQIAPRKR